MRELEVKERSPDRLASPAAVMQDHAASLPRLLQARVAVPVCLVLAALLLLVARAPAYDVWSWLVWGREAAHLDLDTSFGPQFKPLPVLVAALSAPFGAAAVPIWMFVAYATGLLAVIGAARVAWRAYGPVAAAITAVGVLTSTEYTFYLLPSGMSEPMLMACFCWAVDRHLAGRRLAAYALGVTAGLLRPEAWPFVIAYAIWLSRDRDGAGDRRVRPGLLAGLALLMPAAWFLPEWWGSGNPFRTGMGKATPGGPVTTAHPGLTVLANTFDGTLGIIAVGALIGLAVAITQRHRLLLVVAGIGISWLAIVALLAEAGKSSGVTRYLIVTQAAAWILAGAGWVQVVRWARRWLRGRGLARALSAALPLAVVGALAVPSALSFAGEVQPGWAQVRYQQGAYLATAEAVRLAGGKAVLNQCTPYNWSAPLREPEFAWLLDTDLVYGRSEWTPDLDRSAQYGPMVRATLQGTDVLVPQPFSGVGYTVAGTASALGVQAQVLTAC